MKGCLSAVSFIGLYMFVSTAPGRMALTRTPCGPNSAQAQSAGARCEAHRFIAAPSPGVCCCSLVWMRR